MTFIAIIIWIEILISLLLISFCCWLLSPTQHQPAFSITCAKLKNRRRNYWPILDLSVQYRHQHLLVAKEKLVARQELIASKITLLVTVVCIPTTKSPSNATTFRLKLSETYFSASKIQLYAIPDEITKPVSLPADILGKTGVTAEIDIGCYSDYLVIDPLAFRSSQNSLAKFYFTNFDFGLQKDFSFLKGFNRLESLNFSSMNNLTAFQYLPPLPSLQYLSIEGCPDINQIAFPDLSPAKLKKLYLNHNELSEQKADEILTKLAASTSTDSLQQLFLTGNSWTRIPSQVGSTFPKLRGVYLGYNKISHIPIVFSQFCVPFGVVTFRF